MHVFLCSHILSFEVFKSFYRFCHFYGNITEYQWSNLVFEERLYAQFSWHKNSRLWWVDAFFPSQYAQSNAAISYNTRQSLPWGWGSLHPSIIKSFGTNTLPTSQGAVWTNTQTQGSSINGINTKGFVTSSRFIPFPDYGGMHPPPSHPWVSPPPLLGHWNESNLLEKRPLLQTNLSIWTFSGICWREKMSPLRIATPCWMIHEHPLI